ncbi:MAG: hypothetical protein ACFE0I_16045 [Elainellaceae cyanobacterium]
MSGLLISPPRHITLCNPDCLLHQRLIKPGWICRHLQPLRLRIHHRLDWNWNLIKLPAQRSLMKQAIARLHNDNQIQITANPCISPRSGNTDEGNCVAIATAPTHPI